MSKGLFIGRFQPFHLGHLSAIRQALKQVDSLIIGIGSSQHSHKKDNPFTWEEREKMVERALKEIIKNHESAIEIIPLPDINNNEKWPAHVRSLVPHFDILFIGNDGIVKELFEKYIPHDSTKTKGQSQNELQKTKNISIIKVNEEIPICATKIREEMCKNGNWQKYLPKEVAEYIEAIGGADRVKNL